MRRARPRAEGSCARPRVNAQHPSKEEQVSEEERPREEGENPTQQRMDQEGTEDVPIDEEWEGHA